jgi:hypothetical protein
MAGETVLENAVAKIACDAIVDLVDAGGAGLDLVDNGDPNDGDHDDAG